MVKSRDLLPSLAMVLVQIGYAGMNITSKMAMESGMRPLILVAYRQIFATIATFPVAFFLERKTRPKITLRVLVQIFFCSITGATGNQVLYFIGLQNSSPTIACALTNLLPAVTFLLAAIFRQEAVGIRKASGQAKVIGTVVCVAGAMVLSFYHGHTIGIGESKIHWAYVQNITSHGPDSTGSNFFLGPFLIMAAAVSWAVWFIIQTKMSETFAAPYTSTLLMCLMGSIQCGAIALISDHKLADWSLSSPLRLISALYAGVVASALAFCLMSWAIQIKGPLYVSVFSPLLLVVVAVFSWTLLEEKLYTGTFMGSALVVIGLYGVLWGKDREMNENEDEVENQKKVKQQHTVKMNINEDIESRLPAGGGGATTGSGNSSARPTSPGEKWRRKPDWTDLEKAIKDFWSHFVADEVYLKLYCSVLRDERFRVGFLDKFVEKFAAEASDWTIDEDPELKIPKRLMEPLFHAEKKELKKRSRKRASKLKKKEAETQAEDPVITSAIIESNLERMLANTSKVHRNYKAYKEMKTSNQRVSRRIAKSKATLDHLENRFRLN